jgi:hypothetical protein
MLEATQDEYCTPPDAKLVLRELNKAKKEAFDESEVLAEDWLEEGAPNVDLFVHEFLEKRILHHERAAKMELLERNK